VNPKPLPRIRFHGTTYPNGVSKERLFNTFLSHRDFACGQADYELDLETTVLEERAGVPVCHWFRDVDGELVIEFDRLQLASPNRRVIMTESWFAFDEDPSPKPIVFISYSHNDVQHARRLATDFRLAGLEPWFDKDRLEPGQKWEPTITSAIERSDRVVLLMSRRSVNDSGYFHKEIRLALDLVERRPEWAVFLIPVRLEECDSPHLALRSLHWVDLFPESERHEALQRIIGSCRAS
jgi:hypothetical protein